MSEWRAANYGKQSQLEGIPIKAGIGNIANPGNATQNVLDGIQDGLTRGALQVGLSFATQNLDPLLGGLTSSVVGGIVDGVISPADPDNPLGERKGAFAGITETLTRAIGGFTQIGKIVPGDPVTTAQNLAQMNDFTTIVREQGLGAAMETYATSLLYRSSVESLISAGTNFSIQQSINAQLQDPDNLVELDGQSVIQVAVGTDANGNRKFLWVDPTSHALVAALQGPDYLRYTAPPKVHEQTGIAATTDAVVQRTNPDGSTVKQTLVGGELTEVELKNSDGTRMTFKPLPGRSSIGRNAAGELTDAVLEIPDEGYRMSLVGGRVQEEFFQPLKFSAAESSVRSEIEEILIKTTEGEGAGIEIVTRL